MAPLTCLGVGASYWLGISVWSPMIQVEPRQREYSQGVKAETALRLWDSTSCYFYHILLAKINHKAILDSNRLHLLRPPWFSISHIFIIDAIISSYVSFSHPHCSLFTSLSFEAMVPSLVYQLESPGQTFQHWQQRMGWTCLYGFL